MKLIIMYYCLFTATAVTMVSCTKKAQEIPSGKIVKEPRLLGDLVPASVTLDGQNRASVKFAASETAYVFDLNEVSGNVSYHLLTSAIETSAPVRVYLYPNTLEIARIEAVSKTAGLLINQTGYIALFKAD